MYNTQFTNKYLQLKSTLRFEISVTAFIYLDWENALAIELMLSYVPVMQPTNAINRMIKFLIIIVGVSSETLAVVTSSMRGGNTRASAVLLTAPTKEMKSERKGIDSAKTTEKKV